MRKIVGILRPFDYQQQFFVYEDGNKIDSAETPVDDIPNVIFDLIDKYNINQIDLTGPKQYSRGISQNIQKMEVAKYNTNKLIINLI